MSTVCFIYILVINSCPAIFLQLCFAVTLGFFDDIVIPPTALQHPSRFDETEQVWVWEYDTGADGEKHDLFMDAGEIRLRICLVNYCMNVGLLFTLHLYCYR